MATNTTNYSLVKPAVNDPTDADLWGTELNSDLDIIDTQLKTATDTVKSALTGNTTIDNTYRNKILLCDATSASFTVTLQAAATALDGFRIIVKKTDSTANTVTIDGNSSETIDGALTKVLSSQYDVVEIVCDGSNWNIVSTPAGAKLTANTFTGAQIGTVTALTSTSNSIATNLATNNNFSHTFTENTTLANPTNVVAGQSGRIFFTQHASSPKTLAFGTFWLFPALENGGLDPTVTATNSALDVLYYDVLSSTQISCHLSKGLA